MKPFVAVVKLVVAATTISLAHGAPIPHLESKDDWLQKSEEILPRGRTDFLDGVLTDAGEVFEAAAGQAKPEAGTAGTISEEAQHFLDFTPPRRPHPVLGIEQVTAARTPRYLVSDPPATPQQTSTNPALSSLSDPGFRPQSGYKTRASSSSVRTPKLPGRSPVGTSETASMPEEAIAASPKPVVAVRSRLTYKKTSSTPGQLDYAKRYYREHRDRRVAYFAERRQSAEGKKYSQMYIRSGKHRVANRRYEQTDKGRVSRARVRSVQKRRGRQATLEEE